MRIVKVVRIVNIVICLLVLLSFLITMYWLGEEFDDPKVLALSALLGFLVGHFLKSYWPESTWPRDRR